MGKKTLEFKDLKDIEADLYSTDIEAGDIGKLVVSSKYSKFLAGNAGSLEINAYSDKYAFGNTGDIKFTDKYSDLRAEISGTVEMDCYNSTLFMGDCYSDKYVILNTGLEFKGIKVSGKYVNIELALESDLDYRFKANVKYPKFDINEEAMNIIKKIRESSQLEMEAIKGTAKEGMPEFIINGYDMAVTFTEIH